MFLIAPPDRDSKSILLASVHDLEKGTKTEWVIEKSVFRKLPKHTDEDKNQSLSLAQAIKLARKHCQKTSPDQSVKLDSAAYRQPIAEEDRSGVFFYFIQFKVVKKRGGRQYVMY